MKPDSLNRCDEFCYCKVETMFCQLMILLILCMSFLLLPWHVTPFADSSPNYNVMLQILEALVLIFRMGGDVVYQSLCI